MSVSLAHLGRRLAIALVCAATVAGCAKGRGVLLVTVDADGGPIGAVASLRVAATQGTRSAGPFTFPVSAGQVPPAYSFSLSIDAADVGQTALVVDALDAAQATLATGSGVATTLASEVTPLTVHLSSVGECRPACAADRTCVSGLCVGTGFVARTVTTGRFYACALRLDESVTCWGDTTKVKDVHVLSPPSGRYTRIDGGYHHACGLLVDGKVVCWGDPTAGRTEAPDGVYAAVSTGELNACALDKLGAVRCWGDPTTGIDAGPSGAAFRQVAVGTPAACGIRMDGTLECWGSDGAHHISGVPSGRFRQVTVGAYGACAIRDDGAPGTLACWGQDEYGQTKPPAGQYLQVAGGDDVFCAIAADGTPGAITCWGYPEAGLQPPPSGAFRSIDLEWAFPCALRDDYAVVCWDANASPLPSP